MRWITIFVASLAIGAAPAHAQQVDLVGELFKSLIKSKAKRPTGESEAAEVSATGRYQSLEDATPASAVEAAPAAARPGFDIAGVRLGMNVHEVKAALKGAGYKLRAHDKCYLGCTGKSFEQRVRSAVDKLNGGVGYDAEDHAIAALEADGPNGGLVRAEFRMWPTGPQVARVRFFYEMRGDQTFADLAAPAIAKYGEPNRSGAYLVWPKTTKYCAGAAESPCVGANASMSQFNIDLFGTKADAAKFDKLISDTARSRLPKRATPTF